MTRMGDVQRSWCAFPLLNMGGEVMEEWCAIKNGIPDGLVLGNLLKKKTIFLCAFEHFYRYLV